MKRIALVALALVALCSLMPSIFVSAYATGFSFTNYSAITTPTINGTNSPADEWTDTAVPPSLPSSFAFREKWSMPSDIIEYNLIEFFTDNTNSSGDYYQICIDKSANGGTAPQTDDIRIDFVNHGTLHVYRGTGSGWTEFSASDIAVGESQGTSPLNGAQHWIFEISTDRSKADFDVSGSTYAPWIRVAVYDAANSVAGVQAWPTSSTQDSPSTWGLETGSTSTIPETPSIAIFVALSSFAVVASVYLLRKHPKTITAKINITQ